RFHLQQALEYLTKFVQVLRLAGSRERPSHVAPCTEIERGVRHGLAQAVEGFPMVPAVAPYEARHPQDERILRREGERLGGRRQRIGLVAIRFAAEAVHEALHEQ